jgi:hypothetical protein
MPASVNHGIATSLPSIVLLATIASKCSFSTPFEYCFRSRKNVPRMPGHTMSMLNTSMSVEPAARCCCASASCSVDEVGEEITLTLWPVFFVQASTPCLQTSCSLPTEPHEIARETLAAGAAPPAPAEPCMALPAAPGSGLASGFVSFFLQPPANNTVAQSTAAALAFIDCPFFVRVRPDR